MEQNEFYDLVRKMRMHFLAFRRDKSSQDLNAALRYQKKVDQYIKDTEKEKKSKQIKLL